MGGVLDLFRERPWRFMQPMLSFVFRSCLSLVGRRAGKICRYMSHGRAASAYLPRDASRIPTDVVWLWDVAGSVLKLVIAEQIHVIPLPAVAGVRQTGVKLVK